MIPLNLENVKEFPLSDSVLVPLGSTIMGEITNYLRLVTQKIYINLPSGHDKIVTKPPLELSMRRVSTALYQYVSPIAHQLAPKLGLTPTEVCQSFQIQIESANVHNAPYLELDCWFTDASYIYFQLTPNAIASWLDYVRDLPLDFQAGRIAADRSPSSLVLYAHARCCSCLRLARAEKLILLDGAEPAQYSHWQITTPDWLICDRNSIDTCPKIDRRLVFELPVEHQLIHALMDVLDGICGDRSQNWAKLALHLAQNWLEFDRYCQIFGDTRHQNPRLAIARCGLTAISRRYLQVLLEDYLGVRAPSEL